MPQPLVQGDAQAEGMQGENASQTRHTPQDEVRDNTAGGKSATVD
jgi:hypothetical protein